MRQVCHRPALAWALLALLGQPLAASANDTAQTDFSEMSLEDLLNVEVLSASKKLESLADTTAAAYVITAEDIRRSGHTTLPELMRLVPGMEVERVTANTWAVSARGFNSQFANKLLVLMDGRSLYTPLFGGTFWDDHDVALDDIERIEVIRGPGGTIWGANAVNGVINIITKSSKDTVGSHANVIAGSEDHLITSFRHGIKLQNGATLRVFGKYANHDESVFGDGSNGHDDWRNGRLGLRADWQPNERDSVMLDSELHKSDTRLPLQIDDALNRSLGIGTKTQLFDNIDGSGGLLRLGFKRELGERSSLELAGTYDRRDRVADDHFADRRTAIDLTAQQRVPFGQRQDVIWGVGYRLNADGTDDTPNLTLNRQDALDVIYSAFLQDDIAIVPERLKLTLGSKLEWNDYTRWEVQPSARALWTLGPSHAIWAAASRAVRTPNRSVADLQELLFLSVPAGLAGCPGSVLLLDPACHLALTGNKDYKSEVAWSYELGYRVRPVQDVSLDVATFFGDYENLPTFVPTAADPLANQQQNGSSAHTYGLEASARWFVNDWWRLAMTYTGLSIQEKNIRNNGGIEGLAPHNQWRGSSSLNLPGGLELDTHLYYTGRVRTTSFQAFSTNTLWRLDTVLGWHLMQEHLTLRLVAQNLTHRRHSEHSGVVVFLPVQGEVQRAFYAQASLDF